MPWKTVRAMLSDTAPPDGRMLGLFALIAFLGGGVKAMVHRTTWKDAFVAACASGIVGFSTGSTLLYLWGPEKILLIMPLVAIAGWIGIVLMDVAADYAMGRVQARIRDDRTMTATTTLTQTVTTPAQTQPIPPAPVTLVVPPVVATPEKK